MHRSLDSKSTVHGPTADVMEDSILALTASMLQVYDEF